MHASVLHASQLTYAHASTLAPCLRMGAVFLWPNEVAEGLHAGEDIPLMCVG